MTRRKRKQLPVDVEEVRRRRDELLALIDRRATLLEVELAYTFFVVESLAGNKVIAANALAIDRRTIQRWSRKRPGVASRARP